MRPMSIRWRRLGEAQLEQRQQALSSGEDLGLLPEAARGAPAPRAASWARDSRRTQESSRCSFRRTANSSGPEPVDRRAAGPRRRPRKRAGARPRRTRAAGELRRRTRRPRSGVPLTAAPAGATVAAAARRFGLGRAERDCRRGRRPASPARRASRPVNRSNIWSDTSCIRPRPNWARMPVTFTSETTVTSVSPGARSTRRLFIFMSAPPRPLSVLAGGRRSRPCAWPRSSVSKRTVPL